MQSELWNYSFILHTCNLGNTTKLIVNPFTRQQFEVPVDEGLTHYEIEAVKNIFSNNDVRLLEVIADEAWATYANEHATFKCFDLDSSNRIDSIHAELVVAKLSDELLRMILALASDANLALISDHRKTHRFARIVGRPPDERLLERWPDMEELSSVSELRYWLTEQIKGDRVLDRR